VKKEKFYKYKSILLIMTNKNNLVKGIGVGVGLGLCAYVLSLSTYGTDLGEFKNLGISDGMYISQERETGPQQAATFNRLGKSEVSGNFKVSSLNGDVCYFDNFMSNSTDPFYRNSPFESYSLKSNYGVSALKNWKEYNSALNLKCAGALLRHLHEGGVLKAEKYSYY
jgi:hypothetical protein